MMKHCMRGLALLAVVAAYAAVAQERGRTDGPEGSEYGKGGYRRASGSGRFSFGLNFGAALGNSPPLSGAGTGRVPLMVGGTLSFWGDDWFVLDLDGAYNFNQQRVHLNIGPRFRTGFWPVSLWAGLKAGPTITQFEGVRFALTPTVGADIVFDNGILAGIGYAFDIVFAGEHSHRIYMNVGYRF
ncbi:MAG: hypothetical protein ACT4TC_26600 [Myxococcaceae bacterium]